MNITEAKSISFVAFLEALGHYPARHGRTGELWFLSPFRGEKIPSFKLKNDRIFFDHGEGFGGTIIDFVLKYRRTESVKEVLEFLSQFDYLAKRDIQLRKPPRTNDSKIEILSVQQLTSPVLKHYVNHVRSIDLRIASQHLKEIEFRINKRDYVATGFANQSGGWELRNNWFKGGTSPKDISIINSPFNPSKKLSVFEGSMDFLSILSQANSRYLPSDVMVLNSAALKQRALDWIAKHPFNQVDTYFDNDRTGSELTTLFQDHIARCFPQNSAYENFKDVNEHHQACIQAGRPR